MKLERRAKGLEFDSWWPGYMRYFRIDGFKNCHIQRRREGVYGFNSCSEEHPTWHGPEFDSPEEAYLWAQITGAVDE